MSEIAGMLVSALGQGFIYAPMALGVFLTFSILKTPDLTVEGSFVFGMTACVVVTIAGHPILGLVAGTLAGAAAGLCTGLLQTKLKIEPIIWYPYNDGTLHSKLCYSGWSVQPLFTV